MRHYVESIDLSRDAVFVVTDANLAIVGAAHLAREDGQAELGMSVLPRDRGHGVGGALLERCAARARNWGVRVMFMNCLVENAAMMHLARKQGLKIAVSGAEAEAFVRLPQPNLTTLAADAVAEHLGRFDHAEKSYWLAPVSGRCKGFGAGVRNRPKRCCERSTRSHARWPKLRTTSAEDPDWVMAA